MLTAIFTLFYLIFFILWVIAGLFIIYHIARYSLNKKNAALTLIIFISVMAALLLSNVLLFSSLRLEEIIKLDIY
jgi:hypothetical membrane protein